MQDNSANKEQTHASGALGICKSKDDIPADPPLKQKLHGIVPVVAPLSKNALKKKLKQETYMQEREAIKLKRKSDRKDKKIQKKVDAPSQANPDKPRRIPHKYQRPVDVRILIDLDYADYMEEKNMRSLCSQLKMSYSANNMVETPCKLQLSSFVAPITTIMNEMFPEHKSWKMDFDDRAYNQCHTDTSKLMYLTADSENVITELHIGCTYIIGGIVDRNHYPKLCYNRAVQKGIKHARLPLDEFISLKSRKVLTVNNIVEILTQFIVCKDWKTAFMTTIPQRKIKDHHLEKVSHMDSSIDRAPNDTISI